MRIIVCLDNHGGMLFNRRRQSKDSALRQHMLQMVAGGKLWMNGYSASQFSPEDDLCADEAFLEKAGPQDYCFVENEDISAYVSRVEQVIVYRWNRDYPRDMIFPETLVSSKWKLVSREDFPGNSHEKLTQEVYSL